MLIYLQNLISVLGLAANTNIVDGPFSARSHIDENIHKIIYNIIEDISNMATNHHYEIPRFREGGGAFKYSVAHEISGKNRRLSIQCI